MFLGPNLMFWSSKKLHVIAKSSTESEYRALAHTTAELTWLKSLLTELCVPQSSCPIIWCDNLGASCLASNPVAHTRTKHIEIDIHFVRDMVLKKILEICYVPTEEQIADIMTKPLSMSRFQYLMVKLTLGHSPFRLCVWEVTRV